MVCGYYYKRSPLQIAGPGAEQAPAEGRSASGRQEALFGRGTPKVQDHGSYRYGIVNTSRQHQSITEKTLQVTNSFLGNSFAKAKTS